MKALAGSEIWFGAVVAALFALSLFVFAGPALIDVSFWTTILLFSALLVFVTIMGRYLAILDSAPRTLAWFTVGVTCSVFYEFGMGRVPTFEAALLFGAALALTGLVNGRDFLKKDTDNG